MDALGADDYETNVRGNSKDRAASRARLLKEFGDGTTCPCIYCGLKLDDTSVTRDKIYTARQGGRYRHDNLVPACLACNKSRGDTPWESIDWGHK
jgi:5-methylcytosine-specific restriction endonuclease McrA